MENLSSPVFFSDFEDIVQPGAMAVVVLKKPAAALLGHLLCCLMTGDTSFSPQLPDTETEAMRTQSLSGDGPNFKVTVRESVSADTCSFRFLLCWVLCKG